MRSPMAAIACLLLATTVAQAQVPSAVDTQGRLLGVDRNPVEGILSGPNTAFLDDLFASPGLFLELSVAGEVFNPRHAINSVPTALVARDVAGGVVRASRIKLGGETVIGTDGRFVGPLDNLLDAVVTATHAPNNPLSLDAATLGARSTDEYLTRDEFSSTDRENMLTNARFERFPSGAETHPGRRTLAGSEDGLFTAVGSHQPGFDGPSAVAAYRFESAMLPRVAFVPAYRPNLTDRLANEALSDAGSQMRFPSQNVSTHSLCEGLSMASDYDVECSNETTIRNEMCSNSSSNSFIYSGFSARDRDNDRRSGSACISSYSNRSFWYDNCSHTNPFVCNRDRYYRHASKGTVTRRWSWWVR